MDEERLREFVNRPILPSYPSAPEGGRRGTDEARERLVWVRARNAKIRGDDEPVGDPEFKPMPKAES